VLDWLLMLLRQPEVYFALATFVAGLVRQFVPELQDVVTVEFLIALITVLLGGGAARYVKRSVKGPS